MIRKWMLGEGCKTMFQYDRKSAMLTEKMNTC